MRYLIIIGLFCFGFTGFSQAITASGISIQGNLKTVNGENIGNKTLSISFEVRTYTSETDYTKLFSVIAQNVALDSFGNFSTVMPMNDAQFVLIQQNSGKSLHLALRTNSKDLLLFPLHPVPYAVMAYDGVPIGTIVSFMGTVVPSGYLLCDGSGIPNNKKYEALRDIVGTNVPNLTGVFLRGAGSNGAYANAKGPNRRAYQEDMLQSHVHDVDIFSNDGVLKPSTSSEYTEVPANRGNNMVQPRLNPFEQQLNDESGGKNVEDIQGLLMGSYKRLNTSGGTSGTMGFIGSHNHKLEGDLGSYGVSGDDGTPGDTRPANVGVNYMIKF